MKDVWKMEKLKEKGFSLDTESIIELGIIDGIVVDDVIFLELELETRLFKEHWLKWKKFDSYFATSNDGDRVIPIERDSWRKDKELWLSRVFELKDSGELEEVSPLLQTIFLESFKVDYGNGDRRGYLRYVAKYALNRNKTYVVFMKTRDLYGEYAFELFIVKPPYDPYKGRVLAVSKYNCFGVVSLSRFPEIDIIGHNIPIAEDKKLTDEGIIVDEDKEYECRYREKIDRAVERFINLYKHFLRLQREELVEIYEVSGKDAEELLNDEAIMYALLTAYLVQLRVENIL